MSHMTSLKEPWSKYYQSTKLISCSWPFRIMFQGVSYSYCTNQENNTKYRHCRTSEEFLSIPISLKYGYEKKHGYASGSGCSDSWSTSKPTYVLQKFSEFLFSSGPGSPGLGASSIKPPHNIGYELKVQHRVADAHHIRIHLFTLMRIRIRNPAFLFNANPDLAFHFNADPEPSPNFHFNANPDPAPYPNEVILRPLDCRLYKDPILSLNASIMSAHGPPRHYFEPLKLLNFTYMRTPIQLFTLMQNRIQLLK